MLFEDGDDQHKYELLSRESDYVNCLSAPHARGFLSLMQKDLGGDLSSVYELVELVLSHLSTLSFGTLAT